MALATAAAWPSRARGWILIALETSAFGAVASCDRTAPRIEIEVTGDHGALLPCRIHLRDADGRAWKSSVWPAGDDYFVFRGKAEFAADPGTYQYEIERGPEYRALHGSVRVARTGTTTLHLHLERLADLARDGWYAGDLHVHRSPQDVPLLMEAEDLYVAPVITWWNSQNPQGARAASEPLVFDGDRFIDASAGEDERQGGALLYFRLAEPLTLPPSLRDEGGKIGHREGDERDEYPAPAELALAARVKHGVHIDLEKPFWWDVPTWVGLGIVDSIAIAYNQMTRASLHNGEAWGRPRESRYGGPFGDAYYCQDIYYRILDAGIRLAPSAGSASGVLPNPLGYNRVYVHLDGRLDYDSWWQGLKAGRSFVTNGPLLHVTANGALPGHVFQAPAGQNIDVVLDTRVVSNDSLGRVELVRDGRVVEIGAQLGGGKVSFATLSFQRSGWFLVRTIADRSDTFRFASTAPFYVEVGPIPQRISRAAVRFFIDWLEERMDRLRKGTMPADKLSSVLAFHREAEHFWQERLAQANAD